MAPGSIRFECLTAVGNVSRYLSIYGKAEHGEVAVETTTAPVYNGGKSKKARSFAARIRC
jgi:hypothetical protein